MAKYSHLKVFKDFYDFSKICLNSIRLYPRLFKYTLGDKIQDNIYHIIEQMVKANSINHKYEILSETIVNAELLQIQLRLSKDMHCFVNLNVWVELSNRLILILKQLEGWKKSQKTTAPGQN